MGLDYYNILRISRTATQSEVKKAYRRLVLKYNPARHNNDENLRGIFKLIGEAYEVLVTPKYRAIYDQYGEEGLKRGVPTPKEFIQPYVYHGDPDKTYYDFFGTNDPYADLLDYYDNPPPMFDSPLGKGFKIKDNTIVRPLVLSLNEVYTGGLKKMKIQRMVFSNIQCTELNLKEKILSIPIEPGIYPNTEVRFKEEGDQGPTKIPADVVFVTEDKPHPTFTRLGFSDLLVKHQVTLRDALCGTTVHITTLDNRKLVVPINDVITPTYEKVIEGEGLPIPKCPKKKGNLVIRFSIDFPPYLSANVKDKLCEALVASEKEAEEFEEDCPEEK